MVGSSRGVGRKTFDQFDDFKPLAGCESEEGLQQSQAFKRFARWSAEFVVQLRNGCGIFHLAPLMGNGRAFLSKHTAWPGSRYTTVAAGRLDLTTATPILRIARPEIDRAEPDKVETMPRNNPIGKPNRCTKKRPRLTK